jgi:hypothetical protein
MPETKLRCITCNKDYDPASPTIHSRLPAFEEWCVCRECVDACQKHGPLVKLKGGD